MINLILEDDYAVIADINEDGDLNVLDVVILVNLILNDDGEEIMGCTHSPACNYNPDAVVQILYSPQKKQ